MKQVKAGIKGCLIIFVIFMIIAVPTYFGLGVAEVPLTRIRGCQNDNCALTVIDTTLDIQVSFLIYLISGMAFFGQICFVVFGGIGFYALPVELVNMYRFRPNPINKQEYIRRKVNIGDRAERLIKLGQSYETKRPSNKEFNMFNQTVWLLDEEFRNTEIAYKDRGGSIILYYIAFVLGIIGFGLSTTWILHIIIWNLADYNLFLNDVFNGLDGVLSFLGVVVFGIFSFWLLWCVIVGNFKFGIRIPFLFKLHPMKLGQTLMSSFLFNTGLILLTSVAITQFLTVSFDAYARLTQINVIFKEAISNLRILKYFWFYSTYVLLGFALLGLVYFVLKPKDKSQVNVDRK